MCDLFRSPGYLLFSKWTISQRTVSVRAKPVSGRYLFTLSKPLKQTFLRKGGQNYYRGWTSTRLCEKLHISCISSSPVRHPIKGALKNVFSKAAAKVSDRFRSTKNFQHFNNFCGIAPRRSPEAGRKGREIFNISKSSFKKIFSVRCQLPKSSS